MEKYRRLQKKPEKTEPFEVRVTSNTFLRSSLAYVARLFDDKNEKVVIKGMGFVISKALSLATLVRHRFVGLHQTIDFGTLEIMDEYVPVEEGLDNVTLKKKVPNVVITLSFKGLDKAHPGYSAPLPESEITPYEPFGARRGGFRREGERPRRRAGGFGRGPRRSRPAERFEEDEEYDYGRGRSRGRPRRYGGPRRPPRYDNRAYEREEHYDREENYEKDEGEYRYSSRPRRSRNWRGPRRAPRYDADRPAGYEETRRPRYDEAEYEQERQPRYNEGEEYGRRRFRGRPRRRYQDNY